MALQIISGGVAGLWGSELSQRWLGTKFFLQTRRVLGREPGKLIKRTWPLSQICETCNISCSKWGRTTLFVFWANMSCSLNTINLWVSSKCHHLLSVYPRSDLKSVFSSSVARWEEFKLARFPYLNVQFNGLNWGYPRLHRKGADSNLHSPKGLGKWFLHTQRRSGISVRVDEQSHWKMDLFHIPFPVGQSNLFFEWGISFP